MSTFLLLCWLALLVVSFRGALFALEKVNLL